MNTFLKIQLNRACYVSLLNINDTQKGIIEYKNYIKKLNLLSINPFCLMKCLKEKQQAKNIFVEQMKKIAKKFFEEKNYVKAQECYQAIFEVDSKDVENIRNYIVCLEKLEQKDLQLSLAKELIKLNKEQQDYKIISNAYLNVEDYKNAICYYKKGLNFDENKEYGLNDYSRLGFMYFNQYKYHTHDPIDAELADKYFVKALSLAPNNKACLKNAIFGANELKDYQRENTYWQTYFKNNYQSTEDEFTYSASCMLRGDIVEWEKYYEARYKKEPNKGYENKITDKPRYDGTQNLKGKTLLVFGEQGFGDIFLMYGYLDRLSKIAKKIIFYVQDQVYSLLKPCNSNIEIQSYSMIDKKDIEHDYFMLCMSIPYVLKLNKDTICVGEGYIKPDAELTKTYKEKYFKNNKYKVAISFLGNKDGARQRDIPLNSLKLLDKLKNVQFYCFTKDVDDKDLKIFKKNKVINIAKEFSNFAHTAAALECCDLVISSDNCILNLAGAIGKKTFGIFNYHYQFRWYDLSGEDCGWFTSVKPFVNNEYNDWNKNILNVIKEVELLQKNGQ